MATTESPATVARTGQQFLDGLRGDAREIWLDGEKITHPLEHPELAAAAHSIARVFDLQHEHADEMLAPAPDRRPARQRHAPHPALARRPACAAAARSS